MDRIEGVRFLARHRGKVRAVCLVVLSRSDGSFYVFPYSKSGQYFFGARGLAESKIDDTFDVGLQLSSSSLPKLSVHESGQVHIKDPGGQDKAGPLHIPPLASLRGEHVCSVSVDRLDSLPEYSPTIKKAGPKTDRLVHFSDSMESGRIVFMVNGTEPVFRTTNQTSLIQLTCKAGLTVYLGLLAIEQDPLGNERDVKGISVIGGWDPTLAKNATIEYLYLRALVTTT